MHRLFPVDSLGYLSTLSQVGLLLYMFLVGLEFNPKLLRNMGHAAFLTSHVSISVPFLLGSVLALYLYPLLSGDSVRFQEFALFMGAAMSVTAFPVLARILRERDLTRTELGTVSIACAAVNDVTAWCILAGILAFVRASHGARPLWLTVLLLTTFVLVMIVVVKKWLRAFERRFRRKGELSDDMIGLILLVLLGSATITEWLGLHLLFGAFLFGAIMPKADDFVARITEKIESITMVLLLPIFFAFTGLRTSTGMLREAEMWMFCGLIILVAVAGKLGGSFVAARAAGLHWRDAAGVGILMNTRGLMELVILNIGLDMGIIYSGRLFDDGDHGAGYDLYDYASARLGLPAAAHPRRLPASGCSTQALAPGATRRARRQRLKRLGGFDSVVAVDLWSRDQETQSIVEIIRAARTLRESW